MRADHAPDAVPEPGGGHLLRAWWMARDSELFWPWYDAQRPCSLDRDPDIGPGATQARAQYVLQAGTAFRRLVRDLLNYDQSGNWPVAGVPARVSVRKGNGREARLAAAGVPRPVMLPAEPAEWAVVLKSPLRRTN